MLGSQNSCRITKRLPVRASSRTSGDPDDQHPAVLSYHHQRKMNVRRGPAVLQHAMILADSRASDARTARRGAPGQGATRRIYRSCTASASRTARPEGHQLVTPARSDGLRPLYSAASHQRPLAPWFSTRRIAASCANRVASSDHFLHVPESTSCRGRRGPVGNVPSSGLRRGFRGRAAASNCGPLHSVDWSPNGLATWGDGADDSARRLIEVRKNVDIAGAPEIAISSCRPNRQRISLQLRALPYGALLVQECSSDRDRSRRNCFRATG